MSKQEQLESNRKFFAEVATVGRHAIVEKIKALKNAINLLRKTPEGAPQTLRDQLKHWEEELKKTPKS